MNNYKNDGEKQRNGKKAKSFVDKYEKH